MPRKRIAAAAVCSFLILCVLCLIWFFSAQPGTQSAALSEAVQRDIQRSGLTALTPQLGLFTLQQAVRKWAHLYIYLVLGVLCAAEAHLFLPVSPFRPPVQRFCLPAGFCAAAAAADEFHQLFVPGRSGEVRDVGVDCLGALAGILLFTFAVYGWRQWQRRRTKKG